jgi:hypothetical protein
VGGRDGWREVGRGGGWVGMEGGRGGRSKKGGKGKVQCLKMTQSDLTMRCKNPTMEMKDISTADEREFAPPHTIRLLTSPWALEVRLMKHRLSDCRTGQCLVRDFAS